jgi:hypothetical protein
MEGGRGEGNGFKYKISYLSLYASNSLSIKEYVHRNQFGREELRKY